MNIELKLQKLLSRYDFITNVLIFGSYALNKQNDMSDIDIAIQTKKDIDIFELGEIISNLESTLALKTDLVILNNLYKKSPLLAYNIYQSHKPVYINDTGAYSDFKLNALHYYLDFQHVIEDQNIAFLERVKNGTIAKIKTA
ncbi:MAG: nucleotidyltransferase domain-containing protein [Sulfurimonas sp.]|uniref:type VII toxin-antitoxin system MntA family adenylyltransferase antitoxin n=1 Tax=Sulfurimonas sp. TaxID=2022749 RepID=UPI00260C3C3D|nr:nucleotidyltransferase domain-containing protein [Sulfurimonas sp.]MDD5400779.1 nucleotidyltransferase domain-containing protein [Sulfurimonas sp.]